MIRPMIPGILLLLPAVLLAVTIDDHPSPSPMIGFWGDGTGVFPADCDPVMEFAIACRYQVGKGDKKKTITVDADRNIVWKCILPETMVPGNNAGLIIANGRIYKLTEPTASSLGPLLYCIDPSDGKVLWQRDLNHIDLIPAADREQLKEDLAASNAYEPVFQACAQRAYHIHQQVRKRDPEQETPEETKELDEIDRILAPYGVKARTPGFRGYWLYQSVDSPVIKEARQRMAKHGYDFHIDAWIRCGSDAVGYASQTPCSDGERLYVTTAFFDLYCFDLDGKLLWSQYWGDDPKARSGRADHFPSPVLVDDTIVRYWTFSTAKDVDHPTLRCYDKLTGKLRWTTDRTGAEDVGGNNHYFLGTPQVGTIDGVRVIYLADGRAVRAADGKVVAKGMGWAAKGPPFATDGGSMAFYCNDQSGGGYDGGKRNLKTGINAYRLSWTDTTHDQLQVDLAWSATGSDFSGCPLYHDAKVFVQGKHKLTCFEAATGKRLGQYAGTWSDRYKMGVGFGSTHLHWVVGDKLVSGNRAFFSLGPEFELLGYTHHDQLPSGRHYWQYAEQYFFSGNRWFIQRGGSNPEVWCIGDPQAPMRLSRVHAP